MFSGFFGKGDKSDKTPPKDAVDSRGLEVVEDDPDTAWSLWDSALAEQDSRFSADPLFAADPLPTIAPAEAVVVRNEAPAKSATPPAAASAVDLEIPTQPLALEERSIQQRMEDALSRVDLHHHRIANTIRSMWGYKECSVYLNRLIMDGGDGMGHNRIGFNQEAVEGMLILVDLHDKQFGPANIVTGLGLADPTIRAGLDGSRSR
jgi:hypothetical protein